MKSIPRKDAEFDVAQENISCTADVNRDAWNLDGGWLNNTLLPAKEGWKTAWANYQLPSARTPVITFAKNEARKKYDQPLRKLVKNLQSNTKVTDDDLVRMGITIPSSGRTPSPVPTTYPVFRIDSSIMRRVGIHFHDSSSSGSKAKPRGVHGVEIKWGVSATKPEGPDALPHSSFDTHTPFVLEFSEAERGNIVYFCLRWENTTGAKGPWGDMGMAVVP